MCNKNTNEIELLNLAWEELKYRHEYYWKTFFKLGFMIIFLLAIPYIKIDQGALPINDYLFLFPWAALLLSITSSILLYEEHKRVNAISEAYKALKAKFEINASDGRIHIGNYSVLIFLASLGSLSIASINS